MRSWRKKREGLDLEVELRANRPQPSRELIHRLEARVREDGRRSRVGSFRVGFAAALASGVLAALASVGGLGYAATSVNQAVQQASRVVHAQGLTVLHRAQSASRDQYGHKPKAKKRKKHKRRARGVRFRRPPFTG